MMIMIPSRKDLDERAGMKDEAPWVKINGLLPTLADCILTDDNDQPITNATEVVIRARQGEPVEATITRLDVHGVVHAIQVPSDDAWDVGFRAGVEACRAAVIEGLGHDEVCDGPCECDDCEAIRKALEGVGP